MKNRKNIFKSPFKPLKLQSTPDNSNRQGKSKTVPVVGSSSYQITIRKEIGGGRNALSIMHTLLQGQQETY